MKSCNWCGKEFDALNRRGTNRAEHCSVSCGLISDAFWQEHDHRENGESPILAMMRKLNQALGLDQEMETIERSIKRVRESLS